MKISSPPIKFPDYYGIDTPSKEELIASNLSIDEIKEKLGLNSLQFLSIKGLYNAMGYSERNEHSPQYTDHCFTGDYPTELEDRDLEICLNSFHYLMIIDNFFIHMGFYLP